jgi:hypothetical protein
MDSIVYLDWNVFNRIEKKSTLDSTNEETISQIEHLILQKRIITPYSNAHINDLLRGYQKSKEYVPMHLDTLKRQSDNLCITQYWGHNEVTWHYRDVNEFFDSALDDLSMTHKRFTELIDWSGPESALRDFQFKLLKMQRLPDNFGEIYKAHPVLSLMFPKAKTERNMLALCEDIYDFSQTAMKDYTVYKSLRTYLNQSRATLKNHSTTFKNLDKAMADIPRQLNFDETWERFVPKNNTSGNPAYQRITDLYYKTDLSGYKSDERMANMIDDAIHVFYGAQCDYFVTIDERCYSKAKKIYQDLEIPSLVLSPSELLTHIRN